MIPVETGVPIPPAGIKRKQRKPKGVYPWKHMKVGDSFLVPDREVGAMNSAATQYANRTGTKYVVRALDDGVRVWRTA